MGMVEFLGGQAGRVVRVVLGLALIGVGAALGGAWWVLAVVGLLPVATAALDVCLIALLFGRKVSGRAIRAGH